MCKPVSKENIIINALKTVHSTELNMHSLNTIYHASQKKTKGTRIFLSLLLGSTIQTFCKKKISRFLHELLGWHEQYPNDTQLQSRFTPAYLV
jgi:hypothetical protein